MVTICKEGVNETTTVFGEDGEKTTTGMLLEPLVRHTGVDGGMVTIFMTMVELHSLFGRGPLVEFHRLQRWASVRTMYWV